VHRDGDVGEVEDAGLADPRDLVIGQDLDRGGRVDLADDVAEALGGEAPGARARTVPSPRARTAARRKPWPAAWRPMSRSLAMS
jgi:hypothetical protein